MPTNQATLSASTALTVGRRVPWIDATRGVSVVLVVLGHYVLFCVVPAVVVPGGTVKAWDDVVAALSAFRMPMLFAVSGMLAAKYIMGGPSEQALRRAASSYYLYVVWLGIYAAISWWLPSGTRFRIGSFTDFQSKLFEPASPLWFLFALAVYCIALPFACRVKPWVVIMTLGFFSVMVTVYGTGAPHDLVSINAVYFGLGAFALPALFWVANKKLPWIALTLTGSGAVATIMVGAVSIDPFSAALISTGAKILILLGAAGVIARLCTISAFREGAGFLGRHAIEIYVLHIPLIWLVAYIPAELFDTYAVTRWLWPLIGTVLIVALAVGIGWAIRKVGAAVVFNAPRWVTGKPRAENDSRLDPRTARPLS